MIIEEKYASKFQLHYFFNDDSHFMDAVIKNKCEYEALQVIKEVASILEIPLEIDSEALLEGGLKEVWKCLGKNSAQISLLLVVVTIIFSRFPPTNKELDNLKKQDLILSIEEKKLKIEKLKLDLDKKIKLNKQEVEECAEIVNQQIKVTKHKSNYYEYLIPYQKIEQVGFQTLNKFNNPIENEVVVPRKNFHKYILNDNELPTETDESATVFIISPVLEKGRYKWRGLYQNEVINFSMKDDTFKDSVLKKEIKFQNGTFIQAVLDKKRKINRFGEIVISSYAVKTVISISHGDKTINTLQGKKYKARKQQEKNQMLFFKDSN